MQSRTSYGKQGERKRLSPEKLDEQKAKATCVMRLEFKDGNKHTKWSNEHCQKKFTNIGESINELLRVFDKYWRHRTHRAAIFDVRADKITGKHNKIYQFENGSWKLVAPISW